MPRFTPRPQSSARAALARPVAVAVEFLESRTLLAAGALDPTFGSNGTAEFGFGGVMNSGARDAVLQSDGKIVVLSEGENDTNVRLARFTANGQVDTTFASGGIVTVPFAAKALAVRGDNKIVVAGIADADDLLFARYTANGQVDTSFGGGDGQVTQPYFGGSQTADKTITKVLIRPDNNRIYVAGDVDTFDNGLTQFALSAFNEDGTPYQQFGDQFVNTTTTEFGYTNHLADVLLTPDGHVVAVGTMTVSDSHHPNVQQDFAVARYDEHGVLDNAFSGDGKLLVDFGDWPRNDPNSETNDAFDFAQSVARDAAGNLFVAGFSHDPTDDSPFLTAVAKVKPDGTLDTAFGPGGVEGDGRITMSFTVVTSASVNDVAVLPTGKVLVSTATQGFNDIDFGLARLNANGSEDSTFGINGRVFTDIEDDDLPRQLLLQSGKALLVGASTHLNTQPGPMSSSLVMARYLLDDTPTPQRPFGGTPWPVPGVLEFENFDDGGEGVAYHDTDSVNQGEAWRTTGVDIQRVPDNGDDFTLAFAKAGEWTEYTINATQAGTYNVGIEYSSLKGGGKFHLEVDGRAVTPVTTVQSTGDWRNYRTLTPAGINLTAGQHVLRLAMDGNDSIGYVANFNRARFTLAAPPPSNQSPFGLAPISLPGVLSFEDYDRGGEGVAYHDTEPQNLGGAYRSDGADVQMYPNGATVLAFTKAGEWTEYTVDVTQGGVHGISVNYSSLRGGGKFHLEVDGVRLTPTFTLPSTGSWGEFRWLHLGQFNLPAGRHVIRLSLDANDSTGYVVNFNHAAFRFIAPVAPTPFKGAPFQPNQQIEAEDFDAGGEGVAYHDTERQNLGGAYRPLEGVDVQPTGDVGGGYNVGFARPGEYLTYAVDSPSGGTYGLQIRAAALKEGGSGTVEVDGNDAFTFEVPATGDWQKYATINHPKDILIAPGVHTIRVRTEFPDSTGYVGNFNWLKLVS
jgi:uncharacterized delta-60 repeat protein